jgi:MoxR-like ATPase
MLAVRAQALLDGRLAPTLDDVTSLASAALSHRMALSFSARAEGGTVEEVIDALVAEQSLAQAA